jgi:conjugative relaxase-like TrwC/TraI family protein
MPVRGLVAAAFTHRDSRAGDPDLHTHVAVANKVQTLDGRWLSIDGRVLFKANVAASETYITALEQHLRETLGLQFAERPGTDPAKQPIREIVGVDPRLNQRWSTRRAHIHTRRSELAIQFQEDHGGHRHRSKRCIWLSRPPWRPATPSTNPDPPPSNAPPGSTKRQQ